MICGAALFGTIVFLVCVGLALWGVGRIERHEQR